MEFQPLVSIIVPVFNHASFLDEALNSVLFQTYQNWECIIINDGSTDNTEEIATNWVHKDQRFVYFSQENKGVSHARNYGINFSKGGYILPLDADDKISPWYCSRAIDLFHEDDSLKLVYCKAEKFGAEEGIWDLEDFSPERLAISNIIFCSGMFRKLDWKKLGGYDPAMKLGLEDWDFWIALLKNGGKVKRIDDVGFFYRIKSDSRNTSLSRGDFQKLQEYLSVKHADFFVRHLGSFHSLYYKAEQEKEVAGKKEVLDLFCKTIFGFSFFGK